MCFPWCDGCRVSADVSPELAARLYPSHTSVWVSLFASTSEEEEKGEITGSLFQIWADHRAAEPPWRTTGCPSRLWESPPALGTGDKLTDGHFRARFSTIFPMHSRIARLISSCFTLVTVLPICCLLGLISQTGGTARCISCSICGGIISPLTKWHCLFSSFPGTVFGFLQTNQSLTKIAHLNRWTPKRTKIKSFAKRGSVVGFLRNSSTKADKFLPKDFPASLLFN